MAQFAPIVLKDDLDPPAPHSFTPSDISGGIATWKESSAAGIPLGDNKVTYSQATNTNGRIKTVLKFTFPVMQDAVVNGVNRPTVVRTAYGEIDFNFDSSSTKLERGHLMHMMASAIMRGQAAFDTFGDLVIERNGIY